MNKVPPSSGSGRLGRSWDVVRSAVTPLGWMLAGVFVLAVFVSVLLGWQEANVAAAMLLLLLIVAVAFTFGHVELETSIRVAPSRVVVGERAAGELRLRNKHKRSARGLRVELPVGKALGVYSVPVLAPDEETDELFVVPTNRRAIIPVGPVTTVKGDPLAILRRVQVWSDIEEIFVHPRTVPLTTIAAGLIRDMDGQATKQLSPSDVAFHTLRDYVPGDDRRHVHWKSSAKFGKLLVRQYVDTRRSHVAVLLSTDLDEYENEDEFELSVSCAASVAVQALSDDQTLTVLSGGDPLLGYSVKPLLDRFSGIEGSAGSGGVDQCLRAARTRAQDASVIVLCVGGKMPIADVAGLMRRTGTDSTAVVFRSALDSTPGFRKIGAATFFNIPDLTRLGHGMASVTV